MKKNEDKNEDGRKRVWRNCERPWSEVEEDDEEAQVPLHSFHKHIEIEIEIKHYFDTFVLSKLLFYSFSLSIFFVFGFFF